MPNLMIVFISALINFKKWIVNPRIYTLVALIIAFLAYHTTGLTQFAGENGMKLTPWIFPHLMTPPVMQVFACFTILLFSDAPFTDRHMPFMVVRSGRQNWILGQLAYIVLASLIYTLFIFIVSVLVLIPHVSFSFDWGVVINSLGANSRLAPEATVFFDERLISIFSPVVATLISLVLFWMVSTFIGVLIFCFNIVIGHMSGLVATGFLIFMSFFSIIHGRLVLGDWISYVSPISWMSMSFYNWGHAEPFQSPSMMYALFFLIGTILLMGFISVKVFCKKDLSIQAVRGF